MQEHQIGIVMRFVGHQLVDRRGEMVFVPLSCRARCSSAVVTPRDQMLDLVREGSSLLRPFPNGTTTSTKNMAVPELTSLT